jgi:hypothetical protein
MIIIKRILTIFVLFTVTGFLFSDRAFADSIQPASTEAGAVNKIIDEDVNKNNILNVSDVEKKKLTNQSMKINSIMKQK